MVNVFFFILPLLFAGLSLQASNPTSPTYEAGVVEFSYERNQSFTAVEKLKSNLDQYLQIMENAPETLDIIVFPEMTLNDMDTAVETPNPDDKISPCHANYPDGLVKKISCSAKDKSRYVVVNFVTKAKCPDEEMIANKDPRSCAKRDDGFSYYNTNLVFDRNGTIISRYRKFNLFGELVDKPFKPPMIIFDTDFGVKFGHFVCFDLMFRYPAISLVKEQKVSDIVFTTMWYSELPFLTAAQVQKNWAFSNDVNLLAAGANNPEVGSTGTGIYAGKKGALKSVMEGANKTILYTAKVPKKGLGINIPIVEEHEIQSVLDMTKLKLKRDQLESYNITFLDDKESTLESTIFSDKIELCYNELCCRFNYSFSMVLSVNGTSQKPHYRYALAVYHGKRTFDGFADGGVITCAVIACQSEDVATCGVRNESLEFAHEWHKLDIDGIFPIDDQFFYMPTTLDSSVMPLKVDAFRYSLSVQQNVGNKQEYNIQMETLGKARDLYAFGIYGRDFNLDAFPKNEPDAARALEMTSLLVLILAVALTFNNITW